MRRRWKAVEGGDLAWSKSFTRIEGGGCQSRQSWRAILEIASNKRRTATLQARNRCRSARAGRHGTFGLIEELKQVMSLFLLTLRF